MHNLFLDTNIIIDYLGNRSPFDKHAQQLFDGFLDNKFLGHTSVINLIHAHYQLRKNLNEIEARIVIGEVTNLLQISHIPEILAKNALTNNLIKDFEDAVQYELALLSKSDFFITRNLKDFPVSAPFVVCDAETYLKIHRLRE